MENPLSLGEAARSFVTVIREDVTQAWQESQPAELRPPLFTELHQVWLDIGEMNEEMRQLFGNGSGSNKEARLFALSQQVVMCAFTGRQNLSDTYYLRVRNFRDVLGEKAQSHVSEEPESSD